MSGFEVGDIVVLTAGSMRMAVEAVEGDRVSTVWCHEGAIGRDSFPAALLKKWEHREEEKAQKSGARPYRGDREGGGKPWGDKPGRGDREGGGKPWGDKAGGDKPRGKTGWDGKPREKKYFRKD